MVDQSVSNLAVVTSVFTQISNILSSPIVPIQNKVHAFYHLLFSSNPASSIDNQQCCHGAKQYPKLASNCVGDTWPNVIKLNVVKVFIY